MLAHLKALGEQAVLEMDYSTVRPRLSVGEARKLLGSKYRHLNDNQVQDLVMILTLVARNNLKTKGSNK